MKTMSKCLMSLVPFAILSLIGCSDATLSHFSVDEPIPESTVEGVGLAVRLPLTIASIPMDVTSQEEYSQQDFDYLTEIKLRRLSLTISARSDDPTNDSFEDGNEDNFDFLSELELTIKATINDQDRSAVIAILTADDPQIATGTRTLQLTATGVDILDFVEAEGGYRIDVNGRGTVPPDDVLFGGEAVYRVGIGFR